MATRASNSALGKLHEKLAEVMLEALDGESFTDPETEEVVTMKATNPALFTAIAKFLKDNDIVAIPETEDAVDALKKRLEEKRSKTALPDPTKGDMAWPNENRPH